MATEGAQGAGAVGPEGRRWEALEANLRRVEGLVGRLAATQARRRRVPPALQGPGPELWARAATAWATEALANPAALIERQAGYWAESLRAFAQAQGAAPEEAPAPTGDKRFRNPLWESNPWFAYVRRQYEINAEAAMAAVAAAEGLDERDRRKLGFYVRQVVDMLAPTNFLATNPDALQKALETDGESLVAGLQNLVADLERSGGEPLVRLADEGAFRVGGNLATTPGAVVFRNRLMELIQYAPRTERVREVPLVIVPPWINKFYVLDMKAQNSLIRWVVEQGYTVFVVSWVNPDASFRDVSLGTYVEEGFLAAFREARAITGADKVNAVGYCIAGTTLALTLALMRKRKVKDVASATFLTTLTDFSDQGEMAVFLDDDFVDGIEAEAEAEGILDSFYMSRTFSYLRANDLIYGPAIRSYMMGEPPPAFDLLYWNGDSTNLPAAMAIEYLRGLCQEDRFARGGFPLLGETLHLSDVRVPLLAVACETDHIAAWGASYRGVQRMGSADRTFVLSESGHIAGIVNPPSKGKYGHWTNPDLSLPPDRWKAGAERHEGSWWPRWEEWLRGRSGRKVEARPPGDDRHPVLAPAPGTYVTAGPGRAA